MINGKKKEIRKIRLGIRELDGLKCFVNQLGVKPQCLFCKQEGHIKKNFPEKSLKCDRCKGIGHSTSECNFARAANKQQEEALLNAPGNLLKEISTATLKEQFEKESEREKKREELEQKIQKEENKKKMRKKNKNKRTALNKK